MTSETVRSLRKVSSVTGTRGGKGRIWEETKSESRERGEGEARWGKVMDKQVHTGPISSEGKTEGGGAEPEKFQLCQIVS